MRSGLLAVIGVSIAAACSGAEKPSAGAQSSSAPAAAVPGTFRLAVTMKEDSKAWRDPRAAEWSAIAPATLLLNRAPPVFATDRTDPNPAPAAEVRAVRAGATLFLRLRWDDATENSSKASELQPYAAEVIYRRPTADPTSFADAAAVMFPATSDWKTRYPSPMMGDAQEPVRIFFWRSGEPNAVLEGRGRGTLAPAAVPVPFEATASRDAKSWTAVFAVPAPADEDSPVAFALWDGARAQRNGDKFYSPWFRMTKAVLP